jgi:predicted transcriptional regulator
MSKRITIMIDDDLDKKLRLIQAKEITKTSSSISYSRVVNDMLRKQLK